MIARRKGRPARTSNDNPAEGRSVSCKPQVLQGQLARALLDCQAFQRLSSHGWGFRTNARFTPQVAPCSPADTRFECWNIWICRASFGQKHWSASSHQVHRAWRQGLCCRVACAEQLQSFQLLCLFGTVTCKLLPQESAKHWSSPSHNSTAARSCSLKTSLSRADHQIC